MLLPVPREIPVSPEFKNYTQQGIVFKRREKSQVLQAENILERAKEESDKIQKSADDEAGKILAAAKEQYENGFNQGLLEGKKEALDEGLSWLSQVSELKKELFNQLKQQMCETIDKVLGYLLNEQSTAIITQQIESTLTALEFSEKVRIRVPSEMTIDLTDAVKAEKYSNMDIQIIHDPTLKDGQCYISTRYYEIEFSLSKVQKDLIDILHSAFE